MHRVARCPRSNGTSREMRWKIPIARTARKGSGLRLIHQPGHVALDDIEHGSRHQ
jgi:hypothetical protein